VRGFRLILLGNHTLELLEFTLQCLCVYMFMLYVVYAAVIMCLFKLCVASNNVSVPTSMLYFHINYRCTSNCIIVII